MMRAEYRPLSAVCILPALPAGEKRRFERQLKRGLFVYAAARTRPSLASLQVETFRWNVFRPAP
jgi:hypothetical protein